MHCTNHWFHSIPFSKHHTNQPSDQVVLPKNDSLYTTHQLSERLRRHCQQHASLVLPPHDTIRPLFSGLALQRSSVFEWPGSSNEGDGGMTPEEPARRRTSSRTLSLISRYSATATGSLLSPPWRSAITCIPSISLLLSMSHLLTVKVSMVC